MKKNKIRDMKIKPLGNHFECEICESCRPIDNDNFESNLHDGWPKCCGHLMRFTTKESKKGYKVKNKLKLLTPIAIAGIIIFSVGSVAGAASNNLITSLIHNSKSKVRTQTDQHTNELINSIQDSINQKVKSDLNNKTNAVVTQTNGKIDTYFQQRINNISDSQEVKNAKNDVSNFGNQMVSYQEQRIDQAISDAFTGQ